MRTDLLTIYLNDHLAGATLGVAVMKRCARSNEGEPLGRTLREILPEVEEERRLIEGVLQRLGGRLNPAKQAGAWLAEKLGRGKLNGHLVTYSDLSRLEEVEGLLLGVRGRLALLRALQLAASGEPAEPAFDGVDFVALIEAAERQVERLEAHREDAARRAFLGAHAADR